MRDIDLGLESSTIVIKEHTDNENLQDNLTNRLSRKNRHEEQDSMDSGEDTLREDTVSLLT